MGLFNLFAQDLLWLFILPLAYGHRSYLSKAKDFFIYCVQEDALEIIVYALDHGFLDHGFLSNFRSKNQINF